MATCSKAYIVLSAVTDSSGQLDVSIYGTYCSRKDAGKAMFKANAEIPNYRDDYDYNGYFVYELNLE